MASLLITEALKSIDIPKQLPNFRVGGDHNRTNCFCCNRYNKIYINSPHEEAVSYQAAAKAFNHVITPSSDSSARDSVIEDIEALSHFNWDSYSTKDRQKQFKDIELLFIKSIAAIYEKIHDVENNLKEDHNCLENTCNLSFNLATELFQSCLRDISLTHPEKLTAKKLVKELNVISLKIQNKLLIDALKVSHTVSHHLEAKSVNEEK